MLYDKIIDSMSEDDIKVLALTIFGEQMEEILKGQDTTIKCYLISGYLSTFLKDKNDMDKFCDKFDEIRNMLED